MSTWIVPVAKDYENHWSIAKRHGLWDMTAQHKIKAGDTVYFWLADQHRLLGQTLATSDALPLEPGVLKPWTDSGERTYTWRFYFDVLNTDAYSHPTWGTLIAGLSKKGAPQAPREYLTSDDAKHLAGFFSPVSWTPEPPPDRDAERDEILNNKGIDLRHTTYRSIVQRQGQGAFKDALMRAYAGRCAVTGSRALQVLEAAHIVKYNGPHTNRVYNGLLVRADIHTLFDLNRLTIEASSLRIKISPDLMTSEYIKYHDRVLASVPNNRKLLPDPKLLEEHNYSCGWLYE